MMRKLVRLDSEAVASRRWSMKLAPKMKREIVLLKGRKEMEKVEKTKMERPKMEEKKGRKVSGHTAEEKCRAVLSVWTERRKPGEVCRELGVAWSLLSQWQGRAMEGMLLALQPRVAVEKAVALNSRLAVLLERKSKTGVMKGLERRLVRLQGNPAAKQGDLREVATEKKV
jgi:transposase-like protein